MKNQTQRIASFSFNFVSVYHENQGLSPLAKKEKEEYSVNRMEEDNGNKEYV